MRYKIKFNQVLEQNAPNLFTVLGTYTTCSDKIEIRCNVCHYTWSPVAGYFLKHPVCPECRKRIRYENKVKANEPCILPNGYTLVGNYQGMEIPTHIKHNECGHIFRMSPSKCLCPRCSQMTSDETWEQRLGQYGWTLLKRIDIYHAIIQHTCGYIKEINLRNYSHSPTACKRIRCACTLKKTLKEQRRQEKIKRIQAQSDDFFQVTLEKGKKVYTCKICGHRGKACNCKKRVRLQNSFNQRYHTELEAEYELQEAFKGHSLQHLWKHRLCGTVFECTPTRLLSVNKQGRTPCPTCMGIRGVRKTDEQVQKELDLRYGTGTFTLLSSYQGYDQPIQVKHVCGHIYSVIAAQLLHNSAKRNGSYCPACSHSADSIGVQRIQQYLDQHNINYVREYTFSDCRDKNPLPFDFAITDNPLRLIEFDGKQHYQAIEFFGGMEAFLQRQKHDNIKNQYCYDHDIQLLRIPFWEDYIENTLDKFFAEQSKKKEKEGAVV